MSDGYASHGELKGQVGFVVPVWFPQGTDQDMRRDLLRLTLRDSSTFVEPEQICLVNDGDPESDDAVREMVAQGGHMLVSYAPNRGKEFAVTSGIRELLKAHPSLAYLAVRDADGDHFIEDLVHLYRAGREIQQTKSTDRVLIIGRRHRLHPPLGWLRGELEDLQNRILLDSLQYRLARKGEVLDLRFCAGYGETPDFQSGYKLYSREAAKAIFGEVDEGMAGPLSPSDFWHYGTESVSVIQGALSGATLGEVERHTYWGQPVSGFASFRPERFYSAVMSWIFWRLEIPSIQASQIFDNHALRLGLWTAYEGRALLLQVRQIVLDTLGCPAPPVPVGPSFL